MLERIYPAAISILLVVLTICTEFNLGDLVNYKEIMSSAISLGSIAVGFLAAAITLLPSLSNNELVKNLKRMGAYEKLLKYIITSIFGLFGISFLSLFALFIDSSFKYNQYFYYLWIFVLSFSLLSTFRVIRLFLKFLIVTQKNDMN
ncbi:hypothetical protein [Peribacillus sp. TH24]|uniref:hypothetical protein n=1 Tax=Peribacillus sp. TH24 TaxID=2798483 RepID=UPI001911D810|nr:hypothetical protein [Peribacillus sp. TH24]MBK5446845.1 hypothetical protein [Peribacillus sp. TH24]